MNISVNNMETKICLKCQTEKVLSEFRFRKNRGYYESPCKSCVAIQKKLYTELNKENIKEWEKKYKAANKQRFSEKDKEYYRQNKDKKKAYQIKNKEKIRTTQRIYEIERLKRDPHFRLIKRLRNRARKAIKNNIGKKSVSTLEMLGCSIEKCREFLESQFQPNMSWENHGVHGWHIDHVKPCSSFDLTNLDEQKKCFHYTNLQPLWAEDNLSKGNRLNPVRI
jgi:hypothetical protein